MKLNLSQWYKVLAPRATVLISTVNAKGISNAAPFSFVMPVSVTPPLVAFSSDPSHDTVANIRKTKDFVVNLPPENILSQLWICADDFPAGVSEIKKAGLTEMKSKRVKSPRIKECFGWFECKLQKIYSSGDHVLIIGKVLNAEAKDEVMEKGKFSPRKANPLLHIGAEKFALVGKIIKA